MAPSSSELAPLEDLIQRLIHAALEAHADQIADKVEGRLASRLNQPSTRFLIASEAATHLRISHDAFKKLAGQGIFHRESRGRHYVYPEDLLREDMEAASGSTHPRRAGR
jgi:hypothetical protein